MTDVSKQVISQRILYVLEMFPRVSISMLQIGLGTGLSRSIWEPVLQELIDDELVYVYKNIPTQKPSGRHQPQTMISSEYIEEYADYLINTAP